MFLYHGARYRAAIKLGLLERLASNETIADKLRAAGFDEVVVTGSGGSRVAVGKWSGPNTAVELPEQVSSVQAVT